MIIQLTQVRTNDCLATLPEGQNTLLCVLDPKTWVMDGILCHAHFYKLHPKRTAPNCNLPYCNYRESAIACLNKTSPTSSAVGDSSGVNATLIQVVQCQHVTVLSATCGHSDSFVVECAVATSSPHPTVPNNMRQRRHLLS